MTMVDFTRGLQSAHRSQFVQPNDLRRLMLMAVLAIGLSGYIYYKMREPVQLGREAECARPDYADDESIVRTRIETPFDRDPATDDPGEEDEDPDATPPVAQNPSTTPPDAPPDPPMTTSPPPVPPVVPPPTPPAPDPLPPPPTPKPLLFEGNLDGETDFTGLEQTRGYNVVLSWLAKADYEDISSRVSRENLKHDQYFHKPEDYRGHFVAGEGTLVWFKVYPIDTNPAGIGDIYEGMLVNPKTEQAWFFHCIERNEEHIEVGADSGRVEGVFVKVYRFRNKQGQTKDVPFLLTKRVTKVIVEPPTAIRQLGWIIGGLALVMAFGVVVVATYMRKQDESYEAKMAEIKKRRREGKHASPGTSPAPAAPPPGADPSSSAPPPPVPPPPPAVPPPGEAPLPPATPPPGDSPLGPGSPPPPA